MLHPSFPSGDADREIGNWLIRVSRERPLDESTLQFNEITAGCKFEPIPDSI